jgi:UDP-glucose:(heptosyl)LPS alpha-1,3-glucosyltransferase
MRVALTYQRVDPSKGGAETYVADLARRLVAAGHDVALLSESWADGALPPEVRCIPVPPRGRTRAGRIWGFAVESERVLRSLPEPDCSVGFINTWHSDVLIPQGGVHQASLEANARRFRPGPARWLYKLGKQINPKWWGLYRAIERRQYDPARQTRFVAVSEMVRGHLERFHRVPRDRVRVIPNAIDAGRLSVEDPAAVRASFRREHGLSESDLVGLFVGHNFRLKGLAPLLLALKARADRGPGGRAITLLVCGGGRIAPFRAMADRLGLGDRVRWIGFAPDIRACFHASDFFALPSYYDPCSLVVFEALACGLPVITTRCNGAGELITEGGEGFVVDRPDDVPTLAAALDRMADDASRAAMSARATRLGREQSFDRHVARLVELFQEVAASKQAGRRTHFSQGRRAGVGSP